MSPPSSPSKLGTAQHWSSVYDRELENFTSNKDDVGEIWYGEQAQDEAVAFGISCIKRLLWSDEDRANAAMHCNEGLDDEDWLKIGLRTLDLGAGNGCLTLKLLEGPFTNVTASDYVASSLSLSEAVVKEGGFTQKSDTESEGIEKEYNVEFVLDDMRQSKFMDEPFDVIFDKGTMDAFRLCEENDASLYFTCVNSFLKRNGLLILTSCNETVEDMTRSFDGDRGEGEGGNCEWKFEGKFETKRKAFRFGGGEGATYNIVCFRRVK